jgi:hypothetical protein
LTFFSSRKTSLKKDRNLFIFSALPLLLGFPMHCMLPAEPAVLL